MPEGDTIFRAARTLHRALAGRTITRFESVFPALTRVDTDAPICGRSVEQVSARGKHLLMFFSGDLVLHTLDRAFVYWRLPELNERLRLRSIAVRPSDQGPVVDEQDYALPVAVGGMWLSRMTPGTEVRAAVGEVSADGFTPLTVARVLAADDTPGFEPPGATADADLESAARLAAGL